MRIEQLTFTRFIAAISIVIFHYGKQIFPFDLPYAETIFSQANVGVSYFFILSGFVMIIAYGSKKSVSFVSYMKNRLARIYPLYILATVVIVLYLLFATNVPVKIVDVFLNFTFLQNWVPGKALTLNFPSWSLSVEFFFYLCFPFLFNRLYSKINYKKLILPIVVVFIVSQGVFLYFYNLDTYGGSYSKEYFILHYSPIMHLSQFLIGNLAGLYFFNRKKNTSKNYSIHILALLLILCMTLIIDHGPLNYHNGLLAIIFVPLIVLISSDNSWISKAFKSKLLIHLGEISYGIYILQYPVFSITKRILYYMSIRDKSIIFYTCLFMLIIISSVTYKLIEVPLRRRIKKLKLGTT